LARLALGIDIVPHGGVALDHDQRPAGHRLLAKTQPHKLWSVGKTQTHPLGSDWKKSRWAPSLTKALTLNQLVLRFSAEPELLATE
jgi:hypothetical protein